MSSDRRRRVLVVDDDQAIRDLLDDVLAFEGYESRTAADGEAALVVAAEWKPDLIVLDLMMPRMDGWRFREEQLRLDGLRDVPVLVVSASQKIADALHELSADAVVAKPFDLEELIATVERLTTR